MIGSSPLARGLHAAETDRSVRGRIIPARAGFTVDIDFAGDLVQDHPRSRGVYPVGTLRVDGPAGSSPLARGLPPRLISIRRHIRIIPARAGFTVRDRAKRFGLGDHPRSRGVYDPGDRPDPVRTGSSPLARGLRGNILGAVTQGGIIPARAGFTDRDSGAAEGAGDHPRSRGVYGNIMT